MSIGISTDGLKQKILENEPEKLNQAIKEKASSLGLNRIENLKGKDQLQQLKDIEEYGSLMQESIQQTKEQREHDSREKKRKHKIPFKVGLQRYLENCERKSKAEYLKRRIVFRDGGIEQLETQLKMLPFRVLVKEIKESNDNSVIAIPETHTEKFPRNKVVCVGEGVDELVAGDVVIADAYAGVEVVSDGIIYRILSISDIACKVEEY